MPFLKPSDVEEYFLELCEILPCNNSDIVQFSDYIVDNYISEEALFRPHYGQVLPMYHIAQQTHANHFMRNLTQLFTKTILICISLLKFYCSFNPKLMPK
jgi:hypothetical protein